jgi:hypothetical protein
MAIVSVQGVTNDGVASARAETVASSPVGSSTAMATDMVAAVGQDVAVHLSSDTGAVDNLSTPGPDTASEEVMVGQVKASDGPWDKMGEEFGVGKPLDDAAALIKRGVSVALLSHDIFDCPLTHRLYSFKPSVTFITRH